MPRLLNPREAVESLEGISWDKERLPSQHLGTWVLSKKSPWALVLVAARSAGAGADRWGKTHWYLTRWRKSGGVWENFREVRLTDQLFKYLCCYPGSPGQYARDQLVEYMRKSSKLIAKPLPGPTIYRELLDPSKH